MGPADLYGILEKLPQKKDENLLVGYNSDDDAAVYMINDTEAIIQTVDFFPPNVSDPYIFGKRYKFFSYLFHFCWVFKFQA